MEDKIHKTKLLRMARARSCERGGGQTSLEEPGGLQAVGHKDSGRTEHTGTHEHKILLGASRKHQAYCHLISDQSHQESEKNKSLKVGSLTKLMPSCASKSSFFYTENVRIWSFYVPSFNMNLK